MADESFADLADSHVTGGKDGNADEGSPELVHAEVLEAVPPRVVPVDHPLHPADDQPDPLPSFFPGRGGKGGDPGFVEAGHQFPDSLPSDGNGRNDRHPQFLLQGCAVDQDPAVPGLVHHVEGHDRGNSLLEDLDGQNEVSLQGRRVQDDDDLVPAFLDQPPGDFLGFVGRLQGVGSRYVYEAVAGSLGPEGPLHEANGRPGVIRRHRVYTRQAGEEGALAYVRVSGQEDAFRAVIGMRFTGGSGLEAAAAG